ncbi:MAG TPA: indole-3-glycerol phosphate synthase TrpC [Clostridium sp.]|uniref:Indole-3-glycerol phosphate synthase n=1 Tax=Clostridium lapidicellarium TaxID=3240931 RepID=A0ABV4DUS5_9CLOT|nr:indole-3-glycerol phosphate synthase TrpC [Clostridiales bacterium]HBC97131.1 indole-3-glycerol phosphate synthase TrpC [Clostridium sp.]
MILEDIIAKKIPKIRREKQIVPAAKLVKNFNDSTKRDFKRALDKRGISIIAEIKKASPSRGVILKDFDAVKIARIYEKLDIDAVSVLTEENFFQGNDRYIGEVKKVNSKPVLRKDFIIDPYQIYQSKALGADALLLITAILKDRLKEYYKLAEKTGLQCLVEVHDERELETALQTECNIIGINNRNLENFSENLKNTEKLIKKIPSGITVVSESGIKNEEDVRYLESVGADAVLIGETFMRNVNNVSRLHEFVGNIRISSFKY